MPVVALKKTDEIDKQKIESKDKSPLAARINTVKYVIICGISSYQKHQID